MAILEHGIATGREVAFVGDVTEVEVNRMVDEGLLPTEFVKQQPSKREYDLLGTAVALRFNRRCRMLLTKEARKSAIQTWASLYRDGTFKLTTILTGHFFQEVEPRVFLIDLGELSVDLSDDLKSSAERIVQLSMVEKSITTDPEIMGGTPVFKGTRLPIEIVLASLDAGVTMDEMIEDYPTLTADKVEQARTYVKLHPRPGRPRKSHIPKSHSITRRIIPPVHRG